MTPQGIFTLNSNHPLRNLKAEPRREPFDSGNNALAGRGSPIERARRYPDFDLHAAIEEMGGSLKIIVEMPSKSPEEAPEID